MTYMYIFKRKGQKRKYFVYFWTNHNDKHIVNIKVNLFNKFYDGGIENIPKLLQRSSP